MQANTTKRESLNLRIKHDDKLLIDRAAHFCGKNRTDFILEAAKEAAKNALLDQSLIHVDEARFKQFLNLLDQPASNNQQLQRTLSIQAPWSTK